MYGVLLTLEDRFIGKEASVSSLYFLAFAVIAIILGYGWYARTINRSVIHPDPKRATPATLYMDGVDFTPANRHVLFGYQFKSIAALGPIIGPIVAVQWGWLPALLWVIFGTLFLGWVQDYSSIMLSVREDGQTFGALSFRLISPRARTILVMFIYFYLLLLMAAFGKIVGFDLMTNPAVPLGVLLVIAIGLLAGQMTYKWKLDILLTTLITVVLAFGGIWAGTLPAVKSFMESLGGGAQSPLFFGNVTWAQFMWSLVVLVICYLGAVLPIWRWAQPINYVAFWIVFLGIAAGTLGLLIWHPSIPASFPAFTNWNGNLTSTAAAAGVTKTFTSLGPLWPILFVTIACGAISGWHSLVSSSGTARQLESESDGLFVGAGAMFLEMFLAVLSILTAVVGVGAVQGFGKYADLIGSGKAGGVFALGLAEMMHHVGIPVTFGVSFGAVFLTLMALTIMYLVVRFMRVASAEFLGDTIPFFRNASFGSIVALILSAFLIYTGFWARIWILFGGANQLMASMALLLASVWLMARGKNYLWAFIPAIFMFVTTVAALLWTAFAVFRQVAATPNLAVNIMVGNIAAGVIAILLVLAALILVWDGIKALRKLKTGALAEAKG